MKPYAGLTRADLERKVVAASDDELRLWLLDSRRLVRKVVRAELRARARAADRAGVA